MNNEPKTTMLPQSVLSYSKEEGVVEVDANGGRKQFILDRTNECEYTFDWNFSSFHLQHLMGEVLTIVDATIDDDRKNKATKDLIKNRFKAKLDWLFEQANLLGCPTAPAEIE